jgi:hypothetical protein
MLAAAAIAGCGGGGVNTTPIPHVTPSPSPSGTPAPGALAVTPPQFFFGTAGVTQTFALTEQNYGGAFTAVSSSPGVATVAVSGSTVTVTAQSDGVSTITVSDASGHTATIAITVTIAGVSVQ